jgi:Pyruvate/2-oxoacid:ferredoxin oxidoreductase delta subunit
VPEKYHIHTKSAPPRFRPVGKFGIVDWREDCASCHNCVKRACAYGFYRDEADTLHNEVGYLDYVYQCKGCLSCVQDCTKGILTRIVNPEYNRMGDDYYTPAIILATWFQADSGRIPVSGAGYGGPFTGSGFDSIWTDMSEIVRPTRDGIHGREYINTSVDIGRKNDHLVFENGELVASPPLLETPLPVIFEAVPQRWLREPVPEAVSKAAAKLGLMSIVRSNRIAPGQSLEKDRIIPLLDTTEALSDAAFASASMVMVPDRPDIGEVRTALKEKNTEQIVAIRLTASPDTAARAVELARDGAEVMHLLFDPHGLESAPSNPRHARDVLREVHGALVKDGTRDQVTLIASGGIAQAEHVAKAILCGADLVAIDIPLMIALECRLCGECDRGEQCQIALEEIEPEFARERMINLMGAWHSQLLEMMGAMGIREVRRLRGEVGRCMFFEDLEREIFGPLFGTRRKENVAI